MYMLLTTRRRDGGGAAGGGGAGGLQVNLFGNPLLGATHGLSSWEAGDQTGADLPFLQACLGQYVLHAPVYFPMIVTHAGRDVRS